MSKRHTVGQAREEVDRLTSERQASERETAQLAAETERPQGVTHAEIIEALKLACEWGTELQAMLQKEARVKVRLEAIRNARARAEKKQQSVGAIDRLRAALAARGSATVGAPTDPRRNGDQVEADHA